MNDNQKILHFPARIAHLDICHNCTHGGDMVMKCNCPELQSAKDWHKVLPHEYFHIERVRKIRDIAEVRGIYDFSPTLPNLLTKKRRCVSNEETNIST